MGESGGARASANTYRDSGDDGNAATPPWAAAQRDSAEGEEAELPRPPGSDHLGLPRLWPHRHAVSSATPWRSSASTAPGRRAATSTLPASAQPRSVRRRVARPHPAPLAVRLPAAPVRRPFRRPRHGPPRRRRRLVRRQGSAVTHQRRLPSESRDRCVLRGLEPKAVMCCQCQYE